MSKRKNDEPDEDISEELEEDTAEESKCFKNLAEQDVFITEYINKSLSFNGIIKQRFSDFQVNEIDLDGKVVQLTSISVDQNVSDDISQKEENPVEDFDDIDINVKPVDELIYPINSDDQWKQISLLLKREKKEESIRIEVTNVDKDARRELHYEICSRYKNKLISNTLQEKEKKYIVLGTNKSVDKRNFNKWPKEVPQYLYAVLFKENVDTITVAQNISKKLRINQKSVTYAGTKDRRGVTTQWISIRRLEAAKLASISYKDKLCFGNFEFRDEPLKLGDLQGNRFRLALRNVQSSADDIEKTMLNFKANGFINYYGLQRFGSYSAAPTHEIGKCLISKQWKEAINLILKTRPKEGDVNDACKIWSETANASEALKALRRNRDQSVEGMVLKTLSSQGNTAYMNALQKIPRNVTLLYLHSFQSLVWNRIVSRRIKEFGLTPLSGDLIYFERNSADDEDSQQEKCHKSVRVVTSNEFNDIKIEDIVYPLPGYAVKYPDNVIGEWYKEILKEYEVEFDKSDNNRAFSLSGDYRKMIVIPKDVQWKTVHYNDASADLILTDYQKLQKIGHIENFDDGAYKAVIMDFSLPSSTYATMALREITKVDTSASYQASLTFSHLHNKIPKLDSE